MSIQPPATHGMRRVFNINAPSTKSGCGRGNVQMANEDRGLCSASLIGQEAHEVDDKPCFLSQIPP